MKLSVCALGAQTLLLAAGAFAQDRGAENRAVRVDVNAGYSEPTGRAKDYLHGGIIFGLGLSWTPRGEGPFSLQADLHYSDYDASRKLIDQGTLATQTQITGGHGNILGLDASGVYRFPVGANARAYLTAGVGEYYRKIELTQTVLFNGAFCDGWSGLCFSAVVPGGVVVSKDSTTRLGWDGGVGVEIPLARGETVFLDARYHRIESSRPTSFVPLQFGVRF